jgi:hypothetical protein
MLTTWHPLSAKVGNYFAEKRRSLGRYSSLADSDMEFVFCFFLCALYREWVQRWISMKLASAITHLSPYVKCVSLPVIPAYVEFYVKVKTKVKLTL